MRFAAVTSIAAQVPATRPDRGPWSAGWDKPVTPRDGCRLGRAGDKMTVAVSGETHGWNPKDGALTVPHLVRDARGDFAIEVRAGGDFRPAKLAGGLRRAGLLLTDGTQVVRVARAADSRKAGSQTYAAMQAVGLWGGAHAFNPGPSLDRACFLRLERRGQVRRDGKRSYSNLMFCSLDGKGWAPYVPGGGEMGGPMRDRVKVGVFVESAAPGEFKAEFSEFKLTPIPAAK